MRERWAKVPEHPTLELSESGRVRRIPMIKERRGERPHPTKRILLSVEQVAALALDLVALIARLFGACIGKESRSIEAGKARSIEAGKAESHNVVVDTKRRGGR
jgi:hypothetical protein